MDDTSEHNQSGLPVKEDVKTESELKENFDQNQDNQASGQIDTNDEIEMMHFPDPAMQMRHMVSRNIK
jgi:hypothetical protein